MHHSTLLLALSSLASATFTNHLGNKAPTQPGVRPQARDVSLSCDTFETECDGFCIPLTGSCCDIGDGSWCGTGDYCVSLGCCPLGEICDGPPSGCDSDYKECGGSCIPEDAVCCEGSNTYCPAGNTCTSLGCDDGSGSSNSGQTGSDPTPTNTFFHDSTTATAEASPTATTATAAQNDPVLCARGRKGGSFGGGGGGGDDEEDDSSGGGNGGCGVSGADTVGVPLVLLGALGALIAF